MTDLKTQNQILAEHTLIQQLESFAKRWGASALQRITSEACWHAIRHEVDSKPLSQAEAGYSDVATQVALHGIISQPDHTDVSLAPDAPRSPGEQASLLAGIAKQFGNVSGYHNTHDDDH